MELKVGTYNIRFDKNKDHHEGNGWNERLPVIASIIRWEHPDILGVQEAALHQYEDLKELFHEYDSYGVGRLDGRRNGEFTPIFFKKDKFDLVDNGFFWLSETPDQPGKGWDAVIPRVCNWVKLKSPQTARCIFFFNTHLDHVGVVAREKSIALIVEKIAAIAGENPVFLVGDFNVNPTKTGFHKIRAHHLRDTYHESTHKMAWNGTINAFDSGLWSSNRIDYIFASSFIKVTHYAVLTGGYWSPLETEKKIKKGDFPQELLLKPRHHRLPSDHYPVLIRAHI